MAEDVQRPKHYRNRSDIFRLGVSRVSSAYGSSDGHQKRANSEEATVSFIKRVLCVQPAQSNSPTTTTATELDSKPIEELLPPLTSSNEVDVQLYAIIAVILSQFVQNWYNRITPDQQFIAEIVQIIAHCTRGLEQRVRHVDLETLLLDELPTLVTAHVDGVRVAQGTYAGSRLPRDVRAIYHSIHPVQALTPLPETASTILEQQDNEIAWSQLLVSRILPLILPPEDLQNPCLHVLVSEIFSEMIVHNALCGKASEDWLLWEGVTKLIYSLRPDLITRQQQADESSPLTNRLHQFGLLSSGRATVGQDRQNAQRTWSEAIPQVFWMALQFTALAWFLLRSFVSALMHASSIPARSTRRVGLAKTSDKVGVSAVAPDDVPSPLDTVSEGCEVRPVIAIRVWTCLSRLASIDERMPWFAGFLSLLQWLSIHGPGRVCSTNSALDRLMSSQIQAKLLRAQFLPPLLHAIRSALFPDNALAQARVPPTADQVDEIKRACAETIVNIIPEPVRSVYFATKDQRLMQRDVESTLDLFADSYINKHLIVSAVDLLIVRLFPELSEEGTGE